MKFSKLLHYIKKLSINSLRQLYWAKFSMTANLPIHNHVSHKYVFVGKDVYIGYNCRIEGIDKYLERSFSPRIILNNGVTIQQNVHITCASAIVVGDNTAIAANVTITDITHPYDDISVPIENQDIIVKQVTIGADCKIYNNVVILPGVSIGKHCVIGANSVVTHDLPPYCVAVGSPARVIKQYDFEQNMWVKIK